MGENGWSLEVVKGRQAGRSYALAGPEVVLGNALAGAAGIDLAEQEGDSPRRMAARQAVVAATPAGLHRPRPRQPRRHVRQPPARPARPVAAAPRRAT